MCQTDCRIRPARRVELLPRLHWLELRWLMERARAKIDGRWVFIDLSDVHDEVEYEDFESALDRPAPSRLKDGAEAAWHLLAGAVARTLS